MKVHFLAVSIMLVALGMFAATSARADEKADNAALLKALPKSKVTLTDGIKQASKSPEAAISAKFELEGSTLMLSVYTAKAGRQADAVTLLLKSISTARERGSWALAIRSALELARAASSQSETDLNLLQKLYQRLPVDNDTDYGRDAEVLLGASAL